jgi:hypothetical protein
MTEERYNETVTELARTATMDAEKVVALERRLLGAFTDHHAARVAAAPDAGRSESWQGWGAAAAVFVLLVAGVATWRASRATPPGIGVSEVAVRPAPQPPATDAARVLPVPPAARPKPARRPRPAPQIVRSAPFVALPGAAGLPEFESGTIVRLELSLASLPSYGVDITRAGASRPVEADVLVGQDGQPRAIRLVSSDSARFSRSQQ